MKIEFAHPEMRRCSRDARFARQYLGRRVADRYALLLNLLDCIETLTDLQRFASLDIDEASDGCVITISLDNHKRLALRHDEGNNTISIMEVLRDRGPR